MKEFAVENTDLIQATTLIRFRYSKNFKDFHRCMGVRWGGHVLGVEDDGWLRSSTGLYLPSHVDDKRVLFPVAGTTANITASVCISEAGAVQ